MRVANGKLRGALLFLFCTLSTALLPQGCRGPGLGADCYVPPGEYDLVFHATSELCSEFEDGHVETIELWSGIECGEVEVSRFYPYFTHCDRYGQIYTLWVDETGVLWGWVEVIIDCGSVQCQTFYDVTPL